MDDNDRPHDAMARALEQTAEIARQFEGLTAAAARAKAEQYPDRQFQFVRPGDAVTLDLRSNRIRLSLDDDDRVVSASAG